MGNYLSKPVEESVEESLEEPVVGKKTRNRKMRRRPTARRKKTVDNGID